MKVPWPRDFFYLVRPAGGTVSRTACDGTSPVPIASPTNRNRIGGTRARMRRLLSSKSGTCTEGNGFEEKDFTVRVIDDETGIAMGMACGVMAGFLWFASKT